MRFNSFNQFAPVMAPAEKLVFYSQQEQQQQDGPDDPPAPGPTDPPAPPAHFVKPDGTFEDKWQEKFGEDAKGINAKSFPELLKSAKEASSTIGRLNTELEPYKKGMPTDEAGYVAAIKIPTGTELPEGVTLPDGIEKAIAKFAFENKIPPHITNAFINFQVQQAGAEVQAFKTEEFAAVAKAEQEIRDAVGPQNFDTTMASAKAAAGLLGLTLTGEDMVKHPRMVIALAQIQGKLSPGTLKELGIGGPSPNAAGKLDQSKDILHNKENPHYEAFKNPTHPGHAAAQAEYNRLIAEALREGGGGGGRNYYGD